MPGAPTKFDRSFSSFRGRQVVTHHTDQFQWMQQATPDGKDPTSAVIFDLPFTEGTTQPCFLAVVGNGQVSNAYYAGVRPDGTEDLRLWPIFHHGVFKRNQNGRIPRFDKILTSHVYPFEMEERYSPVGNRIWQIQLGFHDFLEVRANNEESVDKERVRVVYKINGSAGKSSTPLLTLKRYDHGWSSPQLETLGSHPTSKFRFPFNYPREYLIK